MSLVCWWRTSSLPILPTFSLTTTRLFHPTRYNTCGIRLYSQLPSEHCEKKESPPPLPVQPVNIPGGPPAVFSITNNPTLDAALTTIVGLGLGTFGLSFFSPQKNNNDCGHPEQYFLAV